MVKFFYIFFLFLPGIYFRVFGKGPKELIDGTTPVQQYLKFETASKSFKALPVRGFLSTVDAVILDAISLKNR